MKLAKQARLAIRTNFLGGTEGDGTKWTYGRRAPFNARARVRRNKKETAGGALPAHHVMAAGDWYMKR
jgi:hypothetical protein